VQFGEESPRYGQERESEEALQMGNLDFFMGSPGVLANFDPKIGIFDLPFLTSTRRR
jgi:TRAP-type C4-dicarboxylate transport system substrate-binding protein